MTILIKNKQRKITIKSGLLKKNIQQILNHIGYTDYDIGIWITTNATIRKFNKKYRKKDTATNVLSFPFYTNLKPNEKIKPQSDVEKILGDIIISAEFVKNEAQTIWNRTFDEHLNAIIIHGICHLLGYTHQADYDFKKMQKKEAELLKLL